MPTSNVSLQSVLTTLASLTGYTPKRSGNGWLARCPCHDDHDASLSVAEGDTQEILVYCHAGCPSTPILQKLGVTSKPSTGRRIVAISEYRDSAGSLLFEKVRYQPKDFRIRHKSIGGDYVWKRPAGIEPPLYRLPELITAIGKGDTVYIVEGEKDCDRLSSLGLTATCNFDGAGKWKQSYTDTLQSAASLIVIPDTDKPGLAHAELILRALPHAKRIILPGLTGETGNKDVSDWLNKGNTVADLLALVDAAPANNDDQPIPTAQRNEQPESATRPAFSDIVSLLALPRAPNWLIKGWLTVDSLAGLFGESGTGKSFIALDWSLCIASGRWWNGRRISSGTVLYIAGEGASGITRRAVAWQIENEPIPDGRFFLSTQTITIGAEGVDLILAEVQRLNTKPVLIVVDTVARCLLGDENSTQDMGEFIQGLDRVRTATGACCLAIHHSGHADKGRARGSSAFRAALDAEIMVERTDEIGTLRTTKAKDWTPPKAAGFQLEPVTLPAEWRDLDDDEPSTSCVVRIQDAAPARRRTGRTAQETIALRALDEAVQREGVPVEGSEGRPAVPEQAWRANAYRRGLKTNDPAENARQKFRRARDKLVSDGTVGCADENYWLVDRNKAEQSGTFCHFVPVHQDGIPGTSGTHPLGGVPFVPVPAGLDHRSEKDFPNGEETPSPEPPAVDSPTADHAEPLADGTIDKVLSEGLPPLRCTWNAIGRLVTKCANPHPTADRTGCAHCGAVKAVAP